MWMVTEDGVYSIVDKSPDGEEYLLVRARDQQSLLDMKDRLVTHVKEDTDGVYVKTGKTDGLMWHGRFWTGDATEDGGTDYEWRMSMPRALLMAYMTLVFEDIKYPNFKNHTAYVWPRHVGEDIATRRSITLEGVWEMIDKLWPRLSPWSERPILRMIQGGADDDNT